MEKIKKGIAVEIRSYRDAKPEKVGDPGAKGATIRWVISEREGAKNFAMRVFEIEPQGTTPYHNHPWEHEIFILEGKGNVVLKEKEIVCQKGDVIFIPPLEEHCFKNTSSGKMELICVVPIQK